MKFIITITLALLPIVSMFVQPNEKITFCISNLELNTEQGTLTLDLTIDTPKLEEQIFISYPTVTLKQGEKIIANMDVFETYGQAVGTATYILHTEMKEIPKDFNCQAYLFDSLWKKPHKSDYPCIKK